MNEQRVPFSVALLSGGIAGLTVDVSLFPIDTIKTRLQSREGFVKCGGFRGIYRGLGAASLGSVPGAAVFFCTYELTKSIGAAHLSTKYDPLVQMAGASVGEILACFVRVPVEVVKQRAQATRQRSFSILRATLQTEGVRGVYRGYLSTVLREVPFSFLQFPLWEFLKRSWSTHQGGPVDAWQSGICGAVSGGTAAAITNPLDVVKTRIILASQNSETAKGNVRFALVEVFRQEGFRGLFAGVLPRVMWISIGGAIFLGAYEKVKITLMSGGL
ncbi:mitochondrial S-adenosylmethionine carrier protein-like isoform X1 [Apostichopus japonicus]|uniref:mitochondrial S-adenosylmethionine carrier protein-like isoform X1 n=1 Tax=Stichopus japonicus TaxID=307972 RepID=UPI003AB55EDD